LDRRLRRLKRVLAANLAALVERSADPEHALREYVAKVQAGRAEVLDELVKARAEAMLLDERRGPSQEQARQWRQEAEGAVQADDEARARQALRRLVVAEEVAREWDEQVARQGEAIGLLEEASRRLGDKQTEAELRLSSLASRHRAAQAAVRVEQVLLELGETGGELGAFRAIAAAVDGEEALAAAMTEISRQTTKARSRVPGGDEKEIERRLLELRQRLTRN
jgi:phage shock protein A